MLRNSYFISVVWKRFRQNRLAMAGATVVGFLFVLSFLAPLITPYDPSHLDAWHVLLPPSAQHWFGTDELGRDVFTRVIYGARVSLKVGFVAVGIAVLIGTAVGLVAGFYGGWLDSLLMRLVDIMLCFPTFFLILAVIAMLEPSIWYIMIIIGLTGWMGVARLVRAEVLTLREREFVLAARAVGARDRRIIFKHIFPNIFGELLVAATLWVGVAIRLEANLAFIGLGVQPPTPTWGNMIREGVDVLINAPGISVYSGLCILVTILAFNMLGDGVRDMIDPRLRGI